MEPSRPTAARLRLPDKLIPYVICLGVFLVYLLFLTRNYYWDGVVFAETIERATSLPVLFHPNHLLYNVVGYLLYKAAGGFGRTARPLLVLQISNCLFSAIALAVLYRILKRTLISGYLAATLTLLFAFSATWWKFSTDADAYISSTLCILIAFLLVLPSAEPRPILVALAHVCALLLHQLAIFFFPVAALGIFYQDRSSSLTVRIRRVLQYTAVTAVLTVGIYVCCFYLAFRTTSPIAFLRWITYYTPENGFTFNPWKDLTASVSGSLRLFFGGRFNLLTPWLNPAVFTLIAILILCVALLAIRILRTPKAPFAFLRALPRLAYNAPDGASSEQAALALLCIVWCSTYVVFLFFFIPFNAFYRLFYLPPLVLLLGLAIARTRASIGLRRAGCAALAVAAMALCNFLFLIFPYSHVRQDTPLSLALSMNGIWTEATEVRYLNKNTDDYLLSYFNPSTKWIALNPADLGRLVGKLQKVYADGGEVWLETTALEAIAAQPGGEDWLRAHTTGKEEHKLTAHGNDIKLVQVFPRVQDPDRTSQ